jgi:hypothetical protein
MDKNTEVEIFLNKSINDSAQEYFKEYKKMKKKLDGLKVAMLETKKRLEIVENQKVEIKEVVKKKKLAWYEKFHFGFTKNNLLIIGGKDSSSNEYLVKNHLEKDDLLFHSTIQGSAHVILKNGQKADREDFEIAALFAAIFSKAWNLGFSSVDVFFVYPDQVSKTAETGEYLDKGAFVIRGEKNFFKKTLMQVAIGIAEINNFDKTSEGKRVFIGSEKLLQEKGINIIAQLIPGREKKGDVAKTIYKKLSKDEQKQISLDEIIQALPPGTMDFVREKKKK